MNRNLILLPVLLQAFTTLLAYLLLRVRRDKATDAGLVNEARRPLHDDAWPDHVLQINNNIRNQFELPVLFYLLCMMLWAVNFVGPFGLAVASFFSLSRLVHLYIHTGSNHVPHRRRAFTFGLAMVVIMFFVTTTGVITMSLA
jgi:hypothetical protein